MYSQFVWKKTIAFAFFEIIYDDACLLYKQGMLRYVLTFGCSK